MKKTKNILLLIFTLLLTLLGAALPYAAARAQDARIARDGSVRSLEAVDLNLWEPTGLCQVLALVDKASRITSPSTLAGELRLTGDEAADAAWDAIWAMRRAGLLESWTGNFPLEASPAVMFSGDRACTAAVWLCSGEDTAYQLILDDATGQMVSVSWESPWIAENMEGYDSYRVLMEDAYAARLKQWVQFCEDYYARDVERVEGSFAEDGGELPDGGRMCILRFFLRDGSEACTLRLMLWETMTAFNG